MLNLLCFDNIASVLPFVLLPFVLFIFIGILVAVVYTRRANEAKRERERNSGTAQYTDGNGRTQQQRDYLAAKRRELNERKIASNDGSHAHSGRVEKYDKIVGSLGEVNDEGCDELDGVRLIEHDESYCDDLDHFVTPDHTELARAIVLGEVLNNPRFKDMYRPKR